MTMASGGRRTLRGKQRSRSRQVTRKIDGHVVVVDPATSKRMGGVRQRNTSPELIVRGVLYSFGLRYRTNNRDLPGSPDIANRSHQWAVFVHGCFWHRHPGCHLTTTPRRNRDFWVAKFNTNKKRDRRVQAELRDQGYRVLVVWECETRDEASLKRRLKRELRSRLG